MFHFAIAGLLSISKLTSDGIIFFCVISFLTLNCDSGRDTPMQSILDLPDVFDNFWMHLEPLGDKPSSSIPPPAKCSLPPFPDRALLPPQHHPFEMPDSLPQLMQRLHKPVQPNLSFFNGLDFRAVTLAPPSQGGETSAHQRVRHVVKQGIASQYHTTLDDVEEHDGCLKLSAYLSLGCITARQIHEELVKLEDGTELDLAQSQGFGGGQNPGTRAIRLELLRRDFIRLCTRKYGRGIFSLEGAGPGRNLDIKWKTPNPQKARLGQKTCYLHVTGALIQFQVGATGYGLIDAIMRQLLCTGYVSSRAQMLAANFLAKYAGIDWRYGAEWIASMSTDHDASLHWYSWQHYAGVGPDPTGGDLTISPAHAGFEYDPNGSFVRKWMPELQRLTKLSNLFQVATTSPELLERLRLSRVVMVNNPVPSNTINLGRPSHRICGPLHPQVFVPMPPHGLMLQGPHRRLIPVRSPRFNPQQLLQSNPVPREGLPRPPPGFVWFFRPEYIRGPYPGFCLAPHPILFRVLQQTLTWLLRIITILRILDQRMARTRTHMSPQQGTQMPNLQNREFALPLRDAPRAPHDAPQGPRMMTSSSRAPRVIQVTRILQAPGTAQRLRETQGPPGVTQELRRTPQAPPNAPQAPRADSQPSQAPRNAPQAPRADSRPSQAPQNASSAPRNAPKAPKALRADSQPSQAPQNAPSAPRADPRPPQAPQQAPKAPRAMRTPPTTPPQSPRVSQAPPLAPRTPEPSSLAGEADQSSRYTSQSSHNAHSGPPYQNLFGPFTFNRAGTLQMMDGVSYYQALRDYHQWRNSNTTGGAWAVGAPADPEEVLRHGMILRFLDSLPPPPSRPAFPPDPPRRHRRSRHRREAQPSDENDASGEAGPSGTTTTVATTAPEDVPSPQSTHNKRTRRGKRGKRGKGGEKGEKSEKGDATEDGQAGIS